MWVCGGRGSWIKSVHSTRIKPYWAWNCPTSRDPHLAPTHRGTSMQAILANQVKYFQTSEGSTCLLYYIHRFFNLQCFIYILPKFTETVPQLFDLRSFYTYCLYEKENSQTYDLGDILRSKQVCICIKESKTRLMIIVIAGKGSCCRNKYLHLCIYLFIQILLLRIRKLGE